MGGFRYVKVGVIMYSMDTALALSLSLSLSLSDYSENSLGNMKYRNCCTYMYIRTLSTW